MDSEGKFKRLSTIEEDADKLQLSLKIEPSKYNIFSMATYRNSRQQHLAPPVGYNMRKSMDQYLRENLAAMQRSLPFQRVFIFAKHLPPEDIQLKGADFKNAFAEKTLDTIANAINESSFKDKFTGLFLFMGGYTLLVLESNEDLIDNFMQQLTVYSQEYWQANRVFLVEQIFGPTYFDLFYIREAGMVHVNETFPSSAPHDIDFMYEEHLLLRNKLRRFCLRLAKKLEETMPPFMARLSMKMSLKKHVEELEAAKVKHALSGEPLPAGKYFRLLPEVQRMDLLLDCDLLCPDLKASAELHTEYAQHIDRDTQIWPTPANLLPAGLFDRTPFDVNITYGNLYTNELMVEEENIVPEGEDHEQAYASREVELDLEEEGVAEEEEEEKLSGEETVTSEETVEEESSTSRDMSIVKSVIILENDTEESHKRVTLLNE